MKKNEKKFDQIEYQNNYISQNYDRISITLPKGRKEIYKAHAKENGKSLTQLIVELLEKDMGNEGEEKMEVEARKAQFIEKNSFGQTTVTQMDFEKKYYKVTEEEFLQTVLPDEKGYAAIANDIIRGMMKFEKWEEPEDCKYVLFDVENGEICNIKDVSREVYFSSLDFVEFK